MVAMNQCGLGHGAGDDGLFDKAAEHETPTSRRPSVEAEREFFQVRLEVFRRHRSLVGAEDPSFEQTGDSMDTRHRNVGRVPGRREYRSLMQVSALAYSVVAPPAVGTDPGTGLDDIANERHYILGHEELTVHPP